MRQKASLAEKSPSYGAKEKTRKCMPMDERSCDMGGHTEILVTTVGRKFVCLKVYWR